MMFNFTERIELLHGIEVDTEDDELYDEACEEAAELLNSRKVQDKNDVLNIFIKLFGKEMNGQNECADCRYYDECGRPERPIKCMGYEEAAVEQQDLQRSKTHRTYKMCI